MEVLKGILITFFALLPSLIWLILYLRRDRHPEPRRLLGLVFLLGFVMTPLVGWLELCLNNPLSASLNLVVTPASPLCQDFVMPAVLGLSQNALPGWLIFFLLVAFIEEFAKYLVVRLSVINNPEFDEPVDVMVYLIVAALGFAASENVFAALNVATSQHLLTNGIVGLDSPIFSLIGLRFIGATLLHTLASGVLGYYLARGYFLIPNRRGNLPHHVLFKGLALATIVHAAFNLFINLSNNLSEINFAAAALALLILGLMAVFHDLKRLQTSIFVIR